MTNYLIKCAIRKTIVVKVGLGVICIATFYHISVGVFYRDPYRLTGTTFRPPNNSRASWYRRRVNSPIIWPSGQINGGRYKPSAIPIPGQGYPTTATIAITKCSISDKMSWSCNDGHHSRHKTSRTIQRIHLIAKDLSRMLTLKHILYDLWQVDYHIFLWKWWLYQSLFIILKLRSYDKIT